MAQFMEQTVFSFSWKIAGFPHSRSYRLFNKSQNKEFPFPRCGDVLFIIAVHAA